MKNFSRKAAQPLLEVNCFAYLKTPKWKWIYHNEHGGSFSNSGGFRNLKQCLSHAFYQLRKGAMASFTADVNFDTLKVDIATISDYDENDHPIEEVKHSTFAKEFPQYKNASKNISMNTRQLAKKAINTKDHRLATRILSADISREEAIKNIIVALDQANKIYNDADKKMSVIYSKLIHNTADFAKEGDPGGDKFSEQFNNYMDGRHDILDGTSKMLRGLRMMAEVLKNS